MPKSKRNGKQADKPASAKKAAQPRKWPVESMSRRRVADLVPYVRNPKEHPPEQVELIAQSMQTYGQAQIVLVDEQAEIIAGHGRVLAAKQLGWDTLVVGEARGWSKSEKQAYRILDNQLTQAAPWDQELLKLELGDLQLANFDLPSLGFSDAELVDLFGVEQDKETERELSEDEAELLDRSWRVMLKEWSDLVATSQQRSYVSTEHTKGALAVWFVRSLLYGHDIPRAATMPYTGHRLFQVGDTDGRPFNELFERACLDPRVLSSLRWSLGEQPTFTGMMNQTLAIQGFRYPFDFPCLLAKELIDEFCPKGGAVLDPCHGWGGRMLGFLLSKAGSYHGFDVDERTTAGVRAMFEDLSQLAYGKKAAILEVCPFEDAKLEPRKFNFALTSPPYFDTESYDGSPLQSSQRYPKFEQWVAGFYGPLIERVAAALKPGGVFALQVGNQRYPLEQTALELARDRFDCVDIRSAGMTNTQAGTSDEDGERVLILQKRGGKPLVVDRAKAFGKVMHAD